MTKNNLILMERFNLIFKEGLSLLMKENHFKKKGNKFIYKGKELSYVVKTYKSLWNTKDILDFRVEWGIEINEDYKKPEIPFKTEVLYGDLGHLTKNVDLRWFRLEISDQDPVNNDTLIKEKITTAIGSTVIPFLFSFQTICQKKKFCGEIQ